MLPSFSSSWLGHAGVLSSVDQTRAIDELLGNWHPSYAGHQVVQVPPGWRNDFFTPYTFVFVNQDLPAEIYASFFKYCAAHKLANTRLFTPGVVKYASVLHPSFYHSITRCSAARSGQFAGLFENTGELRPNQAGYYGKDVSAVMFRLQSVAFLAGVTLSAAIIQNRWSAGTIESKLDRLWQIGEAASQHGMWELMSLGIQDFVLQCAATYREKPLLTLKRLKSFYAKVLKVMVQDIPCEERLMRASPLSPGGKFGFMNDLMALLGSNMKSVVLYGSAVNSKEFSDYDLLIVVENLDEAMQVLAGKSPVYQGLELNISLFSADEFWTYQLASGDNLSDHAVCLFGELTVPYKSFDDLVLRNFSFGFVRLRQLIGMAAQIGFQEDAEDKRNLLDYFIKIPLNVYKGIQGCYNAVATNEEIKEWSKNELGFNVDKNKEISRQGFNTEAISAAACATLQVMQWFDAKYSIFSNQSAKTNDLKNEYHLNH